MAPKPDDRSDNVERIQENIDMTIRNMELADELIEKTSDPKQKESLIEKNKRRRDALSGMRKEIRDEALNRREQESPNQHRDLVHF
jgi:small acid-soluble spore protein (thioredoxin-like protein)